MASEKRGLRRTIGSFKSKSFYFGFFFSFEAFTKNKSQSNLKDTELGTLNSLIQNKDITIQKADKDITFIIFLLFIIVFCLVIIYGLISKQVNKTKLCLASQ